MFESALWWLGLGCNLVPLQPGTKRLIRGFGVYGHAVNDAEGARFWWHRVCPPGLAVLMGRGVICLDFDDVNTFEQFRREYGAAYTERTRRGYHVYYMGDSPTGRVGDVEVIGRGGVVTVAPSVVSGFAYHAITPPPPQLAEIPCAFPLPSERTPHPPRQRDDVVGGDDVVGRVLASVDILGYAQAVGVHVTSQNGRWWHGHCPFDAHDKTRAQGKKPFWIDEERGRWGCFACGGRAGDVINLHARLHSMSLADAIRDLARVWL